MKQRKTNLTWRSCLFHTLIPAAVMAAASPLALADDNNNDESRFHFDGYLREEVSVNAKNWQDTPNYNDKGKISMARTTLRLNMDFKANEAVAFVAKGRAVREFNTPFLKHLESMGANSYRNKGLMDLYNDIDLREWYADIKASDRVKLRIGKQQIVWGETDFFVANDLAQGYDNVWRSFLEPANEELRKGNIALKVNIDVPEANGGIEAFFRPGWDRKRDIGTEIDVYGGRWSSQPYAGVDFRNIDPYAWNNSKADIHSKTGGLRWTGMAGDTNYSVSWMRTFYNMPIMNPSATFMDGVTPSGATPIGSRTTAGPAGEIIYPVVNVFGATASRYSDMADAVFSTEVAYIKDAPFNFAAATPSLMSQFIAPGFDGWKTKNVIAAMIRMDKNFAFTQTFLGTEKPMFFSIQVFDKWIQNFDQNENLLYSVGWGGRVKRHNTLVTAIFDLSYDNGRIHPQLVLGSDVTNGGGFYIPSVTFQLSKNLRWKVEYDGFWDSGFANAPVPGSDRTTLFGYLHKRDQVYTSLSYLF
ncbi:MAG TPA: LysR family transcriptional regulator [Oxalobacteraceae bacterium]|nr:LysR family transcriptional regulator [Oxalobacteraceae bacterium]